MIEDSKKGGKGAGYYQLSWSGHPGSEVQIKQAKH